MAMQWKSFALFVRYVIMPDSRLSGPLSGEIPQNGPNFVRVTSINAGK